MRKTCRKCEENKPIEDFVKHKRSKNGFARLCKACRNLSLAKNRKPRLFVGETERECITCGEIKPFALFKKDSRKSNGVGSRCKDCNSKSGEPIPHKAFHRLKAKQKLYNIEIETTKEEVAQIFEMFEGRCAYCGVKESAETGTFHLEHIIPMSREGSRNHVSNLVCSCSRCNLKKHNRHLVMFYRMHPPFTGEMLDFIFMYIAHFSGRTPEEVAKEFYAEVTEVENDEQTRAILIAQ